jgi:hypothetical protein
MESTRSRKRRVSIKAPLSILARFNLIVGEILPAFYEYNNLVKQKGLYLKPVHVVVRRNPDGGVTKYFYYGRYWYRIERDSLGRLKWVYVGRVKPIPELPDPPENPLEGVVVKQYNDVVEVIFASEEVFKMIYEKLSKELPH